MRELLADFLMETGQAAPALREYRAALKENPNRYRGLYGAAKPLRRRGIGGWPPTILRSSWCCPRTPTPCGPNSLAPRRTSRSYETCGRFALAAAIAVAAASPCLADPDESDSKAARLDPDYAAGKQALGRKDWREAARRFTQAALRDPSNADLQNYLGYSYRNLKQLDLAFKHYGRALDLTRGTAARTSTSARPTCW